MLCFFICILILTWNGCLRELSAAVPETDLVIVINERTHSQFTNTQSIYEHTVNLRTHSQFTNTQSIYEHAVNTVNFPLRTLFITFVICYLKYYFVTKRIIIHKYYHIKRVISMPVCFYIILK